jgi:CelD/BcsL family acetyltransferase involved in cellulose biosynthesis
MTITYRTVKANHLDAAGWRLWSELQAEYSAYESPFFCPEFTRVATSVRDDVEVAIMEKSGVPFGFFPFQRIGKKIQAVMGRLSEFHGAIVRPDVTWSAMDLIRDCQIESWHFDHLPPSQQEFQRYAWGSKPCPSIDLRAGFAAYREQITSRSSSLLQLERKARRLQREVGTVRFVWHDPASSVHASLIDWKSAQHTRTNVLEIFRFAWVRDLFDSLTALPSPLETAQTFSAPLAALYAGDELIAAHLGICSGTVLHVWFPAFNVAYKNYSPGIILLVRMAEAAASRGVRRIDLGPGDERYKQQLKSDDLVVAEGMVSQHRLNAKARAVWFHVKRGIRNSRFRNQLEAPLRATRRLRQWLAFK